LLYNNNHKTNIKISIFTYRSIKTFNVAIIVNNSKPIMTGCTTTAIIHPKTKIKTYYIVFQ